MNDRHPFRVVTPEDAARRVGGYEEPAAEERRQRTGVMAALLLAVVFGLGVAVDSML